MKNSKQLNHLMTAGDRRVNGFTLIELIIAVAVLAIALAGLVSTISHSMRIDTTFEKQNVALQGAQSMMAQIKAQDRSQGGDHIRSFIQNSTNSNNRFDVDDLEAGNNTEGHVSRTGPLNNGVDDDSDGDIDESDESEDLGFITIDIEVEWEGTYGEQEVGISSKVYTYEE